MNIQESLRSVEQDWRDDAAAARERSRLALEDGNFAEMDAQDVRWRMSTQHADRLAGLCVETGVCDSFRAAHGEPNPDDPEAKCARCSFPRRLHE